jgi:outer membrane protein OmpA-like peptidoglycan-associated protein
MSKKLCLIWIATLIAVGTASAGEVGLTAVLYPDGKAIAVPISGTQRAPAAEISASVKHEGGQSTITIPYKKLPPAVLFGGDIVVYVVWAVAPDGRVENVGGIANDGEKGTGTYATAKRDFALMITAEPIATVRRPGELVVFYSGTPSAKNVRPTAFTFSGLSDRRDLIKADRDSIAGLTWEKGKIPLALTQAEKAVELLNRFEAKQYDERAYEGAVNALAEAREVKGNKQIDAAKRSVIFAGQALSQTADMRKAEEKAAQAAKAAASKDELTAEASGLQAQLADTQGKLDSTEIALAGAQAELATLASAKRKLAAQNEAFEAQLSGALGQMASGRQTDRGYVVSLSGVAFASGKSEISTEGKYVLAKLSGMLLVFPDKGLNIEGHTDSTGGEEVNRKLSEARAQAVRVFLNEMGVPESRMEAQGYGPAKPVAPNDTPEGRAKNRRVDIVISEGS